jgi:hypothetical protein
MNLFSDNFGIAKSDEDIASLQNQFPHYDPGYICQGAANTRQKVKAWMEDLWKQYEPYADTQFLEDFKRQFAQRSWELYLGTTLINRNLKLGTHKNSGADFDILSEDGSKRLTWIEAVAVKKGDGTDQVPKTTYGLVVDIPEEKMLLRLANALDKKFKNYQLQLKSGSVKPTESYVIAIDRSDLEHVDTDAPLILKVLFPIGDLTIKVPIGEGMPENPETFWSTRTHINKQSGQGVPMFFFENHEHAGISAVIYSKDTILNSPRLSQEMGENFFIVHNPHAINPLPDNFFPFGAEYKASDGEVKKIRKLKKYTSPDPFDWIL